ncbi:MAG: phosphate starvation-inducible protein PhoH, partial [Saprospiraceae bacterium]|nr:phosphate starvation-inducible protein PhoH [Saprospiraceae bacterium]
MSEIVLTVDDVDLLELFGEKNAKINLLAKSFPEVTITSRGNIIKLVGDKKFTQKVKGKLELMVKLLKQNHELPTQAVKDLLQGENPFAARI